MIRLARPSDVTALTALDAACFPAADRFPRRTWRHLLTTARRNHTCISLLAQRDDAVIGAAAVLLRHASRVARLYTVAVDPTARGSGLGRQLIAALLTRIPARCSILSLEVRTTNTAALRLYHALGLQPYAELPAYYADYADAIRLRGLIADVRLALK